MKGYKFFWAGPLSQWHRSDFELEDQLFVTAEQAMMYFKATLFRDEKIAKRILGTTDPGKQKSLGRKVKGFDEKIWRKKREDIVYRVNTAKFDQNSGLRRTLFQTAGLQLVEASPVDTIWGIGLSAAQAQKQSPETWPGQNLLGQILTGVREELIQKYPDQAANVLKEKAE